MKALVTGGAGFIGSHLVNALLKRGYSVRVLDALIEQVHGPDALPPLDWSEQVEFVKADVRDIETWQMCLRECEVVYHLAAEVGVGQSMYEIVRYMSANTMGTANLMELLANEQNDIKKVIVASSMSIYGEGAYWCSNCGSITPKIRSPQQLERRIWELQCPTCESELDPVPTSEDKALQPSSVYAISKYDQERLCLSVGRAYNIPVVGLRFFNVYGPGQALSNPYTGVVAIFASRLLSGRPPLIFEDGLQLRDFVHVRDVVQSLLLASERDEANYQTFNIGSGEAFRINDIASSVADALEVDVASVIVNQYREGDIRHCFADISKARRLLGYAPRVNFEEGIRGLTQWIKNQSVIDLADTAKAELEERALIR